MSVITVERKVLEKNDAVAAHNRVRLLAHGVFAVNIVSSPEGVHHVLVANADNYPKDRRQLRILQPGLRTGLLTSSGDTWKMARHALLLDV